MFTYLYMHVNMFLVYGMIKSNNKTLQKHQRNKNFIDDDENMEKCFIIFSTCKTNKPGQKIKVRNTKIQSIYATT
jgi:hypothetical protein